MDTKRKIEVMGILNLTGDSFHARTEQAYERLMVENPQRFVPVNAAQSPEDVTEEAFGKLFAKMVQGGVL